MENDLYKSATYLYRLNVEASKINKHGFGSCIIKIKIEGV